MTQLRVTRGEHFVVADNLRVSVLKCNRYGVSFGVCDQNPRGAGAVMSPPLADVCRNRACYFWFRKGGCCTLVVGCRKGKSLALTGQGRLTVSNVSSHGVSVAITDYAITL